MVNWKGIIGKSFESVQEFEDYLRTLEPDNDQWTPEFIVLHNTQDPCLSDYPDGITKAYIDSAVKYYRDELGWSGGPHIFVDDHRIWAFTPLVVPGVHSPSWNQVAIGVEMLGDYDREDFNSGRGAEVQANAVAVVALLSYYFELDPETMRLHKEDPKTQHDFCPGRTVSKSKFIQGVKDYLR